MPVIQKFPEYLVFHDLLKYNWKNLGPYQSPFCLPVFHGHLWTNIELQREEQLKGSNDYVLFLRFPNDIKKPSIHTSKQIWLLQHIRMRQSSPFFRRHVFPPLWVTLYFS